MDGHFGGSTVVRGGHASQPSQEGGADRRSGTRPPSGGGLFEGSSNYFLSQYSIKQDFLTSGPHLGGLCLAPPGEAPLVWTGC